ncbi:MAG: hypothetical protein ACOC2H_04865 [Spirochaetota bacterium]
MAPVKSVVSYFVHNTQEVTRFDLILGFKTPADILFQDETESWKQKRRSN